MPRISRVVVPGMPHHVTARGTRRFNVFTDDADRQRYLTLLTESCQRFLLHVWAYCLMTNHVHFIAVPERADSIWRTFHRTNGGYSKEFNLRHGFVGHLWGERPFSCVLSDSHLMNAVRYVERNPVRAGVVVKASDYRWSSAPAHCSGDTDPLIEGGSELLDNLVNWAEWLDGDDDPEFEPLIRERTFKGRPCGSDDFVNSVAWSTGRDFAVKRRGRKIGGPPNSESEDFFV